MFSGKRGRKSHLCTSIAMPVLGQATVEQSERTQYLGVILTTALSWTPHVDNLIRRVSYKVYMLKRLAYHCGSNAYLRHPYLSLVQPVLECAGPVWDYCTLEDCLRVERLQLFPFGCKGNLTSKPSHKVNCVRSSGDRMVNIGVETSSIQATALLEVVKSAGTAFSAVQATASCFGASNADTPKEYLPPGCV